MSSENNNKSSSGGGISFLGALGLLFIGLKLGDVIDWSWWYVLMPIYLPLAIGLSFALIILFVALIAVIFGKK